MDLIHKFLNITFPIFSIIIFIFLLPALWLFNLLRFCVKSLYAKNLAGKVILITGASSGIGEHLAYEFAKKGACLALIARRMEKLEAVAGKAKELGSPEVKVISADVSKIDDCKRFVDETINHFGELDYLVNNAGIATYGLFEDHTSISDHTSIMDTNFWGSVYTTHFAIPHLRKSKGRIIVIGSCGGWFATPRVTVYNASKAAVIGFFETLRNELGSDIEISMITPGMVNSYLTNDDWCKEANAMWIPKESAEDCAKAIVDSTRRGDRYLTEPSWMKMVFLWKMFCPEIVNPFSHFVFVGMAKNTRKQHFYNSYFDQLFGFKAE